MWQVRITLLMNYDRLLYELIHLIGLGLIRKKDGGCFRRGLSGSFFLASGRRLNSFVLRLLIRMKTSLAPAGFSSVAEVRSDHPSSVNDLYNRPMRPY